MNKIILTIFLLLTTSTLLLADDVIYDKPYGGKKVFNPNVNKSTVNVKRV